jgi:hypothetical protein
VRCGIKNSTYSVIITKLRFIQQRQKIDNYIAEMTQGDIDTCLKRLALAYLPNKQNTENQIRNLAKQNPIRYTCNITIPDHRGRPIAIIKPLSEDLEGHIVVQMYENIQINYKVGFFRTIINNILKQHDITVESLKKYLYQSPIFQLSNQIILERSIYAYLTSDPICFLHLAIPQIENMLRALIERDNQQPIIKEGKNEGFNLILFDQILRDSTLIKSFGEDIVFYFKVVFTDQRGFNLRNNICHGLALSEEFSMENADLIFHILLVLAMLKYREF